MFRRKTNLAIRNAEDNAILYRIEPLDAESAARITAGEDHLDENDRVEIAHQFRSVAWLKSTNVNIEDLESLIVSEDKPAPTTPEANWLRDFLKDGPRPATECFENARLAFSTRVKDEWWRDAVLKKQLRGEPRRDGRESKWYWTLPHHAWPLPDHAEDGARLQGDEEVPLPGPT